MWNPSLLSKLHSVLCDSDIQEKKLENMIYILVLERCHSSVLAMELRLSCTNPSIYGRKQRTKFNNSVRKQYEKLHACFLQITLE